MMRLHPETGHLGDAGLWRGPCLRWSEKVEGGEVQTECGGKVVVRMLSEMHHREMWVEKEGDAAVVDSEGRDTGWEKAREAE